MKILLACIVVIWHPAADDGDALIKAIVTLTGVSSAEELSEGETERFMSLASSPLKINSARRGRLISSGLLSSYQIASVEDYRSRHGDILSAAELAMVDGFGFETAEALACFLSFEPSTLPGRLPSAGKRTHSMILRTSAAARDDGNENGQGWSAGIKYRYSDEDRGETGFALRRNYDDGAAFPPPDYTFHAVRYGSRGKVAIGDYNARFGQGLVLWSGFTTSSLPAVSAFSRKASGVSPSWSYSPENSLRGLAAERNFGAFRLSAMTAGYGETFAGGANLTWFLKDGQIGVTAYGNPIPGEKRVKPRISADMNWNIRGVQLFSEVAAGFEKASFAFVAGAVSGLPGGGKGAVRLRSLPAAFSGKKNGEHGISAGAEFSAGSYVKLRGRSGFGSSEKRHRLSLTADAAALPVPISGPDRRQFAAVALYSFRLSPSVSVAMRFSGKWRNYGVARREDLRADAEWSDGNWTVRSRLNAVRSENWGVLCYTDAGYGGKRLSVYFRAAYYHADSWNDRIYCYERDAPGNFNVPAYYGRGFALSLTGSAGLGRGTRKNKLYFRLSRKKPGKAELKLQYMTVF